MHKVQLLVTPSHGCSYLDDHSARMLFIDPKEVITDGMLSELSRQGFRRSGGYVYKPDCQQCHQCLSIRLPVKQFKPNKSQKRTLKHNRDVTHNIIQSNQATKQHYELYERYINTRHKDGEMYPPSPEQFDKFLVESFADSVFIEYWLEEKLIGVAVTDILDDGMSAVYTFYDPDYPKRSLGTFSILKQVEILNMLEKPYLYLGHWVPESQKMNYKRHFSPQEIFINDKWYSVDKKLTDDDVTKLKKAVQTNNIEYIQLINLPT